MGETPQELPYCTDGLRAEKTEEPLPGRVYIRVSAKIGGEPVGEPVTVASFPLDADGRTDASLLLPLVQAFCRYVNAGGDLQDLAQHMAPMAAALRGLPVGLAENWRPLATLQEVPQPAHFFVDADDNCLVLIEDQYSDIVPVEAVPEFFA